MTSEVVSRSVTEWRKKAREGTLSVEDMRQALIDMRAERLAAGAVSVKSGEKKATAAKKAQAVDSDALLRELSM